jgi:hypothetical protein
MIIQCIVNSFREQMLQGQHDLLTDTLKIALYTCYATLGPETTAYSTDNEATGTGYVPGGVVLTGTTIQVGTPSLYTPSTVYVNFDNAVFNAETTARAALIYNSSKSDKAIAVLDFGSDKTSTATFTVQMPPNTSTAALLRFP